MRACGLICSAPGSHSTISKFASAIICSFPFLGWFVLCIYIFFGGWSVCACIPFIPMSLNAKTQPCVCTLPCVCSFDRAEHQWFVACTKWHSKVAYNRKIMKGVMLHQFCQSFKAEPVKIWLVENSHNILVHVQELS